MKALLTFLLAAAPAWGGERTETELKKEWEKQWHRPDATDSASVKIEKLTKEGFQFAFEATAGANVGEMGGTAKFENDHRAKATLGKCNVTFALPIEAGFDSRVGTPYLVVSTDGDCNEFAPSGVEFDGQYLQPGVKPTFKAGFDCKWADTQVENAICADELLADADRELTWLFSALQGPDPFSKSEKKLKSEQMAWLKGRNAKCETSTTRTDCLVDWYAKRITELQAQLKKTRLTKSAVLFFDEYVKPQIDESKDKLWKDPLARLVLRRHLGQQHYDLLRAHNLYLAEETPKPTVPAKEIAVFATIRGTTEQAGIVLTKDGHLWAALPTVDKNKWQPLVFGPKDQKIPEPAALKEWLSTAKTAGWKAPLFKRVF